MKRYWISWMQPGDDYRPLTYPPNPGILGWWCTGNYDGGSMICALVSAEGVDAARKAIAIDWPDHGSWRFCEPKQPEYTPSADRFPLSNWMKTRILVV